MQIRGWHLGFDTVAMVIWKTGIGSKHLDPSYASIISCGIHQPFTIRILDLKFRHNASNMQMRGGHLEFQRVTFKVCIIMHHNEFL